MTEDDRCAPFRALLSPAHDGALVPREELALTKHLESCAPCREARASLHETVALLRRTPLMEPSGDFLERLDARLEREAKAKDETLPRLEVLLAGAPTALATRSIARARLGASLKAAVVLLSLASSTFLFLEALDRRSSREGGGLASLDGLVPAPAPTPTPGALAPIPSTVSPFTDAPGPIDVPGEIAVTPTIPEPSTAPEEPPFDPRAVIPRDPIVGPDTAASPGPSPAPSPLPAPATSPGPAPSPTPAPSPAPGTQGRAPSPSASPLPRAHDTAALDRIIAEIFVDPTTPAEQRPGLVTALAEFQQPKSYDALSRILAGALDAAPLANECRAHAYQALGALGTEEAARALLAVRAPDETQLLLALARVADAKAVAWLAARVADHPDEDGRILVARALGRGGRLEALPGLVRVLESSRQPPLVRAEAARALGALGDARAERPLARALESARVPAVRGAAARGLGALAERGLAAAVVALEGPLAKDPHPYVREACALALGRAGSPAAVRPLVARLDPTKEPSRRVRSAAHEALAVLTGERRTPDEWRRALEKNEPFDTRSRVTVAIARDGLAELASGEGTVFLLDRSGSMAQRGKIDLAKATIAGALERLPESARDPGARGFSIVAFADSPTAFFPRLVEPSPENLAHARAGLARQRAWWAPTDLLRAIRSALSFEGTDTLVLVTDGVPTLGVADPEQLLLEVARENAARGARIHVVALEDGERPLEVELGATVPPEGEAPALGLLRRLALDNGGVFVKN